MSYEFYDNEADWQLKKEANQDALAKIKARKVGLGKAAMLLLGNL